MKKVPINLLIGGILVFVVLFTAALSLIWTPHDHALMNISEKFHQPNNIYLLGTDQLGRDILSQLMAASRNSMAVALIAVLLGGTIGTLLGLLASTIGGWIEELVMRFADIGFAFPALLFAIMLAAVFGPSLTNAILAIAFINIPIFARIARASANQVWSLDFVTASKAAGMGLSLIHI